MTSMFARILAIGCFLAASLSVAQTGTGDLPAAPSSAAASSAAPPVATGNKVATISIEQAIYASNEGQRDFEALGKKLEPKQTELKTMNDELEALKKQLNPPAGDKLTDPQRGAIVKQVEQKQKALERAVQDARDDAQNQQNEIAQRILGKMAPVMVKFAADNGFGLLLDTSSPWPQGPVIWAGSTVDITRAVVDAYNLQSGVPAPPKPAAAAPAKPAARPAAPTNVTPK